MNHYITTEYLWASNLLDATFVNPIYTTISTDQVILPLNEKGERISLLNLTIKNEGTTALQISINGSKAFISIATGASFSFEGMLLNQFTIVGAAGQKFSGYAYYTSL